MAAILFLVCWASVIFYFFGAKIVQLYDVLLVVVTHFYPLWPIVMIAGAVVLIVALAPRRAVE